MSKDIENKVVSMIFDNSEFEKPAEQTMSTIERLKKALNFKGVTDGFDTMQKGIKAVTFSPIEKGIDSVYAKFTFLERFTIQFYDRLANKIINTGRMIAAETFSIPITTGKNEYEEKMGAVQTIMSSTGRTLSEVNGVLAELNKYADDTIYSFKDMTTNIGKFTNAGVKLEDAVAAIKGISNEAAISGANANEASRAMYNFAQALSSGSVKLIDWKSIELANMATKEFKQELIDTAVAVGKLTKGTDGFYRTTQGKAFTATSKFNDALQDQWMTSEVLIKTLKKYSDASTDIGKRASAAATEVKTFRMLIDTLKEALQSGWSESWEHIFGDFNQAKELWTSVSKVLGGLIDRMSEARNTMLKFWSQFGGRTALLQGISNAWKALTTILGAVRNAFRTVVPPMTGQRLVNLTKRFESFTKRLIPSIDTTRKVQNAFIGLFNIIGIGIDAAKALINAFKPLISSVMKNLFSAFSKSSGGFKDWVVNLRKAIKEGQVFEKVFGGIASVLTAIGRMLKTVFGSIGRILTAFKTDGFVGGLRAIKTEFVFLIKSMTKTVMDLNPIEKIKALGSAIANTISKWPILGAFVDLLKSLYEFLKTNGVTRAIVNIFESLVKAVQTAINKFAKIDISGIRKTNDKIAGEFKVFNALKRIIEVIFDGLVKAFEIIIPVIKRLGSSLYKVLKTIFGSFGTIVKNSDLGDVGGLIAGIGIGIKSAISAITTNKSSLRSMVEGLNFTLSNAGKALFAFTNLTNAKAIKEIAKSIALLAASLLLISSIPKNRVTDSTAAILELFAGLTIVMKTIKGFNASVQGSVSLGAVSVAMVSIAASVLVLTGALAILSFISYDNALKGIAIIYTLFAVLSSTIKKLGSSPKTIFTSVPILAMTAFIMAVSLALVPLSIISAIKENAIMTSVAAVTSIVLVMALACSAISRASKIGNITSAAPIISMSMLVLAVGLALTPLGIIAAIDKDAIEAAMLAFIAVLFSVTLAIIAISNASKIKAIFSASPIISMVGVILAVSVALSTLALVAKLDSDALMVAVFGFTTVFGAIVAAYILISRTASSMSILRVTPFVLMTTSLIAIAISISILTRVVKGREDAMVSAIGGLTTAMAMLIALFAMLSSIGSYKSVLSAAAFMLMVGELGVVAVALAGLTAVLNGRELAAITAGGLLLLLIGGLAAIVAALAKIKAPSLMSIFKMVAIAGALTLLMIPIIGIVTSVALLASKADSDSGNEMILAITRFGLILGALMMIPVIMKELLARWKIEDALKVAVIGYALEKLISIIIKACSGLSGVSAKDIGKLLLLSGGVAVITLILNRANKLKKVSTNVKAFSMILASMSASLLAFVAVVKLLSKTTIDFGTFERNIRGLAVAVIETRDDIAMALAAVISGAVEALLASVYNTLEVGLGNTLDMLIRVLPSLLNKVFDLVIVAANTLKTRAPELAESLVSTLVVVVSSVAAAIRNHSTEIIVAIDKLLEAVLTLIVKGIGKIFGVSVHDLDMFAEELLPAAKRITMILLSIFAVDKLMTLTYKVSNIFRGVGSIISTIGDKLKKTKKIGFDTAKSLDEKASSLFAKIKTGASDIFGKIKTFVAGHPLLTAATALGVALGATLIVATKLMKTITKEDERAIETANKLKELEEEYQSTLERRNSIFKESSSDYLVYQRAADQIDEMVDANGKLKDGYDKQFDALAKILDAVVTLKIADDGRIQILTKENELIDYRKDALDDILKKQLRLDKIEAAKVEYQKALEDDTNLAIKYDEAKKEFDRYRNEVVNTFDDDSFLGRFNEYTKGSLIDKYNAYFKARTEGLSKREAAVRSGIIGEDEARGNKWTDDELDEYLSSFADEISSFVGEYQLLSQTVDQTSVAWARNRSYIAEYEEALKAVSSNAADADEKLSKLSRNVMLSSESGLLSKSALIGTYRTELENAVSSYRTLYSAYGERLSEDEKDKNRKIIDSIIDEAKSAGVEISDIMTTSGIGSWDSYYSGFTKNISKDMDKAGDYVGEGFEQSVKKMEPTWTRLSEHMADSFHSRFAKRLGIESPSKVFAKLGTYTVLGLIEGVESEIPNLEEASKAMAVASLSAYNSVANSEASTFAWAPLIDTTGIQNGTAAIQGQLTSLQNNPLTASMTSKLAASVDTSSLEMDNTRILNSMTYIQEEISALKDTMANLQVVMDSGLLVGALAPGMDMELGRRTVRKERGV